VSNCRYLGETSDRCCQRSDLRIISSLNRLSRAISHSIRDFDVDSVLPGTPRYNTPQRPPLFVAASGHRCRQSIYRQPVLRRPPK